MLSNSVLKCFQQMSIRSMHVTPALSSSVFIKKQKKVDPEVAKIREKRKRRKLEAEIRRIQREGKAIKPLFEIKIDPKIEENISQYRRPEAELTDDEIDRRIVVMKAYSKSRAALMIEDDKWIRKMLIDQESALKALKEMSPELYQAAIQPADDYLPHCIQGPTLTAPINNYHSPDGDYVDTTPEWGARKKK